MNELDRLLLIGEQLSNIAFNWAQMPNVVPGESQRAMLSRISKAWDEASMVYRKAKPAKPEPTFHGLRVIVDPTLPPGTIKVETPGGLPPGAIGAEQRPDGLTVYHYPDDPSVRLNLWDKAKPHYYCNKCGGDIPNGVPMCPKCFPEG